MNTPLPRKSGVSGVSGVLFPPSRRKCQNEEKLTVTDSPAGAAEDSTDSTDSALAITTKHRKLALPAVPLPIPRSPDESEGRAMSPTPTTGGPSHPAPVYVVELRSLYPTDDPSVDLRLLLKSAVPPASFAAWGFAKLARISTTGATVRRGDP